MCSLKIKLIVVNSKEKEHNNNVIYNKNIWYIANVTKHE